MKVRFAPSPTGYLHIGGLRTCLYDYLLAKKYDGKYILRIEDTDQGRLVDDATKKLIETLLALGLKHDEGPFIAEDGEITEVGDAKPYIQSKRLAIYQPYIEQLIASGHAYYCFCSKERLDSVREEQKKIGQTPRYDGLCKTIDLEEAKKRIEAGESYVVRLKLPENQDITFTDAVRGEVTFNTRELDDQVLLKADGFPTYHMAVVVDDHLMGVTKVVRGEEWLSSTPKHICLYQALGWDIPEYVHLPLILNREKKKLSKRQDDVAVEDFLAKGYLQEALINFVALLGWSPDGDQEIMSIDEIIAQFDESRLSKSPAVFDLDKLNWMNAQYIRNYDLEKLVELVIPFLVKDNIFSIEEVAAKRDWIELLVKAARERVTVLEDFAKIAQSLLAEELTLEAEAKSVLEADYAQAVLEAYLEALAEIEEYTAENVKAPFKVVQKATAYKGKQLFMTTRVAISGETHGLDMADLLMLLGKAKVEQRINYALEKYVKE